MTTALIVVGVIIFFVIDGIILMKVFASRRSAGDHGTLEVPGEMNVALQPGKVKLTYQESIKAKSDDDRIYFEVPAGLTVTVSSAGGGEPLEIKGPGFRGSGSSVSTGSGWSRAVIGTVEIPGAGEYTVAASPAAEGAVEPRILIGV